MHPVLFETSGFVLYTQTVCLVAAFIAGLLVAIHEGRRFAIAQFELTNIVLLGFIASIFGARLFFLLLSQDLSLMSPQTFCTLGTNEGGFAFHGGLLVGGLVSLLVAWHYQLPIWRLGDALAPGLAAAMFFMRLGCLFNGCDYGVATTVPWGVLLHGTQRHPIQLYEGLGNLLLLPLLIVANKKPLKPGTTFLSYLMVSGLIRVGVDMYREELVRIWNLFTIPQLVAAGIALFAGIGLSYQCWLKK